MKQVKVIIFDAHIVQDVHSDRIASVDLYKLEKLAKSNRLICTFVMNVNKNSKLILPVLR